MWRVGEKGDDATLLQESCWATPKTQYLTAEGEEARIRETQ